MTKSTGSISIALATYNGGKYIDQQLDSFLRQSVLPDEVVVSDDGSTDDTMLRLQRFSDNAPFPVRIIRNSGRLGFADNFLQAIAGCRSQFVALSDQDDVWVPQKLSRCLAVLTRDSSCLVVHAATKVDDSMTPIGTLDQLSNRDRLIPPLGVRPGPGMGFGMSFVFARGLTGLIDSGARPHSITTPTQLLAHDEWILLLASIFGKISTIRDELVLYRQHGSNLFGQPTIPLRQKVGFLLEISPERHRRSRQYADETAKLLERYADRLDSEYQVHARAGAAYYRRLTDLFSFRAGLYSARSVPQRLSHFLKIADQGGYNNDGLGRRSMLKDAAFSFLPVISTMCDEVCL